MEGNPPSPDLFLARRAAAGHEDAWSDLVDRHGRRLFNLAFQFAGSREEAEDLTQEIFVRLYQNLRTYRGEVPLLGWTLRLSRNLCIDHYRRTRRERRWHRVTEAVLEQLPSVRDFEAEAQRRQHLEAVYSALSQLPEEHAEAVLLCDLQGLSQEEASAYLDVPVGTIKSRLYRGRQYLTETVRTRLGIAGPSKNETERATEGGPSC
jgi:RNA polymerase sigma-70 factor (ECF subfamily)